MKTDNHQNDLVLTFVHGCGWRGGDGAWWEGEALRPVRGEKERVSESTAEIMSRQEASPQPLLLRLTK